MLVQQALQRAVFPPLMENVQQMDDGQEIVSILEDTWSRIE